MLLLNENLVYSEMTKLDPERDTACLLLLLTVHCIQKETSGSQHHQT